MPAPLPPLEPAEPCQTWSGVFFVRRCGRPAVARCRRCGAPACADHLRPAPDAPGAAPSFLCLRCIRPAPGMRPSRALDGPSSSGDAAGGRGGGWAGGGGAFSGGGASGRWGPAAPAAVAGALAGTDAPEPPMAGLGAVVPGADPVFTEADYAAFAAMSDADKDDGGPSYDS